jgi:hypothetical protein
VPQIKEEELARAIERTLVRKGKLPPDSAKSTAHMVLSYFGLHDSVLDNKLSSEDRDHFYQMEEEGLLSSEEEDATVARGKTWRIHYWLLKKDRIRDVSQSGEAPVATGDEEVYRKMADSDWHRPGDRGPPGP